MNKLLFASLITLAVTALSSESASAQYPGNLGFFPYGFYQPYGATYGSGIRRPPYFATNPPVYYGARHARPYGLSPFASPPLVTARGDYQSRLRSQFSQPQVPTPGPAPRIVPAPCAPCNPCIHHGAVSVDSGMRVAKLGPVRTNPFVDKSVADQDRIAKN